MEAAEAGDHKIVIADQDGCSIDNVVAGRKTYLPTGGSVTVPVTVKNHSSGDATYFVYVDCA